jgi:Response regulator containing a CheY-like receiver domain and an HD-GYP domain
MSRFKTKTIHHLNIVILIVLSILLNFFLSGLARRLELPLYLDTIGTVLAAMLGGNLAAVIVGFFSNAVNAIYDITKLYYGIISILIGVLASIFHTKRFFEHPMKVLLAIVIFACIGGGLGSFFTYFLQGSDFGAGISAPLSSAIYSMTGSSKLFSEFCADIIIDFFDKTLVVAVAIIIYRMIPDFYKRYTKWVFLFSPAPSNEDSEHRGEIKRSLLRKVIVMVIVAEILLGTLATVTGFILYRQVSVGKFTDIAQGVTKAASIVIDAERIDEFIEKGRNAKGYNEIEKNLYGIKESFPQTTYLYVYKILEDGCHVVFDLDSEGVEAGEPGEIVEFDPTFVPYLPKLFKGEEIEPIFSDDQFGKLLTVYRPLKGSTYVAADIAIDEIVADEFKFVIKLLSVFFGLSIIIMSIVLEFVNRGIVYPVNRMASASMKFAYRFEHDGEAAFKFMESLKIRTFDEIENLYKSILKMCRDLLNYIKQLSIQNKRITRMQNEIIINFAEMVEARDNSTGNHIKKTAFYVEAIAKELRKNGRFTEILTDAYIAKLKRSAPLHDIGKIAVPDSILNKPGKLTEEEFEIMKSHAIEGQKILKKIEANASDSMDDDYLKESIEMALYHHEKWNGAGYPNGLRGEDIPLSARIMAVADVFDALVAERVYKKAMPYEKAMEIILEGAGTSFDPVIVEAFSHIARELYDKRTVLE